MGGEVFVLGILALFTWLIPFFGLPIPIIGLVWGIIILRRRPAKKGLPIAGVVLSSIGLFLSVSYSVISLISSPDDLFSSNNPPGGGGPPASTGPVDWKADGKIEIGEYEGSLVVGANFQVYWKTDTQFIYMAISAPTTGWIGIGFIDSLRSGPMDMIAGYGGAGVAAGNVYDMWSNSHYPNWSVISDPDTGGQMSLLERAALEEIPAASDESESPPYTVLEFRRRFTTGDAFDLPLLSGPNLFVWAYGNNEDVRATPTYRGYGVLELP